MKTIGVLGGLGPQATMSFEQMVHSVSQELIPPWAGSGYPPMVVYYCRFPPILLDENNRPVVPIQPEPRLLQAASRLGAIADFLVITANGPHTLQAQIEEAAGKPVLSMIDLALVELARRAWQKVGLLTMGPPLVYTQRLDKLGVAYVALPATLQARLDKALLSVMEGSDGYQEQSVAHEAAEALWHEGVDGILLGCTELPFLFGRTANPAEMIDPLPMLAGAAVELAMQP